jgi:hypothetical protein
MRRGVVAVSVAVVVALLGVACGEGDSAMQSRTRKPNPAREDRAGTLPPDCVASGEATITVPDVKGELLTDAIRDVEHVGLNVVGYGTPGDDPAGASARVRTQEPSGGERVPAGACIGFRTED